MKQEVIAGIVLCIIGISLLAVSPDKLWAVTEKWKTNGDGQPSKGYTVLMRFLGAVFAGVGGIIAVWGLLKA